MILYTYEQHDSIHNEHQWNVLALTSVLIVVDVVFIAVLLVVQNCKQCVSWSDIITPIK